MVNSAQTLTTSAVLGKQRAHIFAYVMLTAVILANVAGSVYWVQRNVVILGHDAGGHLERTLDVARLLAQPSLHTLFTVLTFHDLRPPILYLLAQPFYWFFGFSARSAQLANIGLLALILWLTFEFGRQWANGWVGLLAALLTGLLPMMTAMSRLFYPDNLVAVLVLFNLLTLLKCENFHNRRWSLAWGISLGLGVLAKSPYPLHILLPALYVLWQADFFPHQWQALQKLRVNWRRLGLASLLAVVVVALWYLPNRAYVFKEKMLLGDWLVVVWLALLIPLFYAFFSTREPLRPGLNNVWTAGLLALTLASIWYAPRINYISYGADAAVGTYGGNYQAADPLRLANYTRYWDYLWMIHLGLLGTVVILPFGLWPWLVRAVRALPTVPATALTRGANGGQRTRDGARLGSWLLWGSVLSTYVVLSFLSQDGERNLVPMLPIFALLWADGLRVYPRRLAFTVGAVWVLALAMQWAVYTFDSLDNFYNRTAVLWVKGEFLARPASGMTDPRNWIAPDVLQRIGSPKGEAPTLGFLIDTRPLHRGQFRYLINKDNLNIELNPLTESGDRGWSAMLANRWVLIKDGDNRDVKGPGVALIQRILHGDPLFQLLYQEVKHYPLPNNETAYLYYRAEGSGHPRDYPVILIQTATIAEMINGSWSKGATLYLSNADLATWVGIHDLKADHIVMPTLGAPNLDKLLRKAKGTIFAVTRYDTAQVQGYLHNTSYATAQQITSGEFAVAIFGRPERPLQALPVKGAWAGIKLTQLHSLSPLYPGGVLPVELTATGRTDGSLKVSARLVNPSGEVVAQNDTALREHISLGLFLPPDAQPGRYTLAAVVYDPKTLTPLKDLTDNEMASLATIGVQARAQ